MQLSIFVWSESLVDKNCAILADILNKNESQVIVTPDFHLLFGDFNSYPGVGLWKIKNIFHEYTFSKRINRQSIPETS